MFNSIRKKSGEHSTQITQKELDKSGFFLELRAKSFAADSQIK
jgi:hypothetical protein